jgi:hypothetical protein
MEVHVKCQGRSKRLVLRGSTYGQSLYTKERCRRSIYVGGARLGMQTRQTRSEQEGEALKP